MSIIDIFTDEIAYDETYREICANLMDTYDKMYAAIEDLVDKGMLTIMEKRDWDDLVYTLADQYYNPEGDEPNAFDLYDNLMIEYKQFKYDHHKKIMEWMEMCVESKCLTSQEIVDEMEVYFSM